MDRTERFYLIDQLLQNQRVVSMQQLLSELEVSRATIKRDLEYLRDRLQAPIIWDPVRRGYRYESDATHDERFELPGLWFNAVEAQALLTMDALLNDLQPGLLGPHIEPLRNRIRLLLSTGDHSVEEVGKRIHLLHVAARPVDTGYFEVIASALLKRVRLEIDHYSRSSDKTLTREISPQRLVYYRDNWYLDAWCHLRKGLRSFSVDAIRRAVSLPAKAKPISEERLDEALGSSYGIFSGKPRHRAVLRFTPERARWVSREIWHPDQETEFDKYGYYLLTIPYSDDRELIMDILKHGQDVEVLRPQALRKKVKAVLMQSLWRYEETET